MSGFKIFKFEYGKRLWEPCVRSQGRTCCAWPWQILSNSTCDIFWRVGNLSHDDWHMCALYFNSLVNTDLQCLEVSLATVPYTTISYMWRWCRSGGLLEKGSSSSQMQLMSDHFAHLTTYPIFLRFLPSHLFTPGGPRASFYQLAKRHARCRASSSHCCWRHWRRSPVPRRKLKLQHSKCSDISLCDVGSKILAVEAIWGPNFLTCKQVQLPKPKRIESLFGHSKTVVNSISCPTWQSRSDFNTWV